MPHNRSLTCFGGIVLCAAVLSFPKAARAQGGIGARVGASGDPQQFYFGGHVEVGPVADRLWFRPNLEIGVGNGLTLTTANFEFVYYIPVPAMRDWRLYAGGGPALNIFRINGSNSSGGGVTALAGVAHRDGFFGELKFGVADSPGIKFGVGYTWKR